jgi:hypothetical protein
MKGNHLNGGAGLLKWTLRWNNRYGFGVYGPCGGTMGMVLFFMNLVVEQQV